MAAKSFVKMRGFVFCGNVVLQRQLSYDFKSLFRNLHKSYHFSTRVHQRQRLLHQNKLQCFPFSTTAKNFTNGEVSVKYENGLPVFYVPLPSRQELCQFTLRPLSNNLGDFIQCLQDEDHGIDRVTAYSPEGTRLAKSTPIDILLQNNFELVINDKTYQINPPALVSGQHEQLQELSDVKNTIAQLYSTLNVEQHQLDREREILTRLEDLKIQMQPYEEVKKEISEKALKRTNMLPWVGLSFMGLQFGILARLTWWEYSWDIMEPVTYFVTYGTSMVFFAYCVLTKQECTYVEACNREFLLTFHKHAKKKNFNIEHYNKLCDSIQEAELDLKRLRDPLQLQLPIEQLDIKPKNQTEF